LGLVFEESQLDSEQEAVEKGENQGGSYRSVSESD